MNRAVPILLLVSIIVAGCAGGLSGDEADRIARNAASTVVASLPTPDQPETPTAVSIPATPTPIVLPATPTPLVFPATPTPQPTATPAPTPTPIDLSQLRSTPSIIEGPPGPRGPQGPIGPIGPQGAAGSAASRTRVVTNQFSCSFSLAYTQTTAGRRCLTITLGERSVVTVLALGTIQVRVVSAGPPLAFGEDITLDPPPNLDPVGGLPGSGGVIQQLPLTVIRSFTLDAGNHDFYVVGRNPLGTLAEFINVQAVAFVERL